eukprot:gene7965-8823_t
MAKHKRENSADELLIGDVTSFYEDMQSLISNKQYSDVKLIVTGSDEVIYGHKAILAARCDYFKALFASSKSDSYEYNVDGILSNHFKVLLEFIYTNCCRELNGDNVFHILAAANRFSLNELIEAAVTFGLDKLKQKLMLFFEDHTTQLMKQDSFQELSQPTLVYILQSDKLNIDEFDIYIMVKEWCTVRSVVLEISISEAAANVVNCIRFPLLTSEQLSRVENENTDGFVPVELISKAWKHLAMNTPVGSSVSTTPRKDFKMHQPKADSIIEYKLRVPRKNPQEAEEERSASPSSGAGSQFGKDKKDETKRKRRGFAQKEINSEDMLYSLQLCGKKDKKFDGKKEGTILDNSSYYIMTQCPDGVFEAMPIQAWYNFKSSIDYQVLSSDDVEREFSKRDKTINYHNMMVQKRLQAMDDKEDDQILGEKVKQTYRDDLLIHDDEDDEEVESSEDESDNENKTFKKKPKNTQTAKSKKKDGYTSKKKAKDNDSENDINSDEEEELDNYESKEFDYMSESSSTDEERALQDEPEPETKKVGKAKDDLNVVLSESESDEAEEELTSVGKELKEMLKREAGEDGSSEDEDEDIDESEKYSKSALFMPGSEGKKKKSARSGSISGSSSSSRSATPTQAGDANRPATPQASKKSSQEESSRKRPSSRESNDSKSPPSKKEKLQGSIQGDKHSSKKAQGDTQKVVQKETDAKEALQITEATIRRYLSHKPMTTTDVVKKFKTKKTGLTKDQTVSTIAAILKKIGPERQTIDGKLYLSIKPSKK